MPPHPVRTSRQDSQETQQARPHYPPAISSTMSNPTKISVHSCPSVVKNRLWTDSPPKEIVDKIDSVQIQSRRFYRHGMGLYNESRQSRAAWKAVSQQALQIIARPVDGQTTTGAGQMTTARDKFGCQVRAHQDDSLLHGWRGRATAHRSRLPGRLDAGCAEHDHGQLRWHSSALFDTCHPVL